MHLGEQSLWWFVSLTVWSLEPCHACHSFSFTFFMMLGVEPTGLHEHPHHFAALQPFRIFIGTMHALSPIHKLLIPNLLVGVKGPVF